MTRAAAALGLCAVCAKYVNPSLFLVPSNRTTSKCSQNKQGCSVLCNTHGPDALQSRSATAANGVLGVEVSSYHLW